MPTSWAATAADKNYSCIGRAAVAVAAGNSSSDSKPHTSHVASSTVAVVDIVPHCCYVVVGIVPHCYNALSTVVSRPVRKWRRVIAGSFLSFPVVISIGGARLGWS